MILVTSRFEAFVNSRLRPITMKLYLIVPVFQLECDIDGAISRQRIVYRADGSGQIRLFGEHGSTKFERKLPKFLTQKSSSAGSGDSAVAPMPGVVEKINVQEGDDVKAGDPLVVMIAMKMEYVIKAPKDGKVQKVFHGVGDFVAKDTLLVKVTETEACEVPASNLN